MSLHKNASWNLLRSKQCQLVPIVQAVADKALISIWALTVISDWTRHDVAKKIKNFIEM